MCYTPMFSCSNPCLDCIKIHGSYSSKGLWKNVNEYINCTCNSRSMKSLTIFSFFLYLEYTTPQFEKRCEIFHKNNRYTAFVSADAKRVKPVSINAFRSYGKTRSQNAFSSQKFTPWVWNHHVHHEWASSWKQIKLSISRLIFLAFWRVEIPWNHRSFASLKKNRNHLMPIC